MTGDNMATAHIKGSKKYIDWLAKHLEPIRKVNNDMCKRLQ